MAEEMLNEKNNIALEMKHITKLYAGTVALEDVNLSINKGEVHGLIGKNGAGKSTLVGIISGIIPPSQGEIIVNGNSYRSLTPILAKKQKISIITQEPQVIEESTVTENLFLPGYIGGKQIIDWIAMGKKAKEILDEVGFPIDPYMKVRDLTVSEKQLLLVIKSCYVENAEIIIMDEVSASLNQNDEKILYKIIDERIIAGKTVIFISHHTDELLKVCKRVTVLRDGKSVGCHKCTDLDMKSLATLIVGDVGNDVSAMEHNFSTISNEVVFELKEFTSYGKFKNINLKLHKGEIVGIAGLRGSGRTELFKSICGIDTHNDGSIMLQGIEKSYKSPAAACEDGVLYLAEERETEGLIQISSIKKNLTINILPQLSKGGFILKKLENESSNDLIKTLNIKAYSPDQEINQLSGGNKQKVLVGKIMARKPLVCLLDEPTRGVDIEAKESILNSINTEMRKSSCALISSPGVDDLIKICDRIVVLYKGEIIYQFARNEFSEQDIYRVMQGEIIHN